MMRITTISDSDSLCRLQLEGRLAAAELGELAAAVEPALDRGRTALVDLAGVVFADAAAVDFLAALRRRGAVLVGASGYLAEMLRAVEPAAPPPGAAAAEEDGLLARLRHGDGDAFAELVRAHGGRLLAVARRLLRDEDEAQDAVQEGLLSAFRAIGGFNGQAQLSTWLHRIVVNAALMRLRRSKRRGEQSIEDLLPRFDDEGYWLEEPSRAALPGDELLENRETRALVRRCIDLLPNGYRTVLLMRDIEDLDTEETAHALGVSANAVKVRLHRARQALRALIVRESGTPPAAARIEAGSSEANA